MTTTELKEATDHWVEPPFAPEPKPVKEYQLTREPTRTPGTGRYRVQHNTPEGVKVYYVSWGSSAMHCTCPDATCRPSRQGRCKHCRFVAGLIGRDDLKAKTDDPNF